MMETLALNIGLNGSTCIPKSSIELIYFMVTTRPGSAELCREALPQLFEDPTQAWKLADAFGEASFRAYIESCADSSLPVNFVGKNKAAAGCKTGFELAISAFYLAKKHDPINPINPKAVSHIETPQYIGTDYRDISCDVQIFEALLEACRMYHGSKEPLSDAYREGMIAGSAAGIVALAERHIALVAEFQATDIDDGLAPIKD